MLAVRGGRGASVQRRQLAFYMRFTRTSRTSVDRASMPIIWQVANHATISTQNRKLPRTGIATRPIGNVECVSQEQGPVLTAGNVKEPPRGCDASTPYLIRHSV